MSSIEDDDLRVLQLLPCAPGWQAVYRDEAGGVIRRPLLGWTLVEVDVSADAPRRYVDGLVVGWHGRVELAQCAGPFMRFERFEPPAPARAGAPWLIIRGVPHG